MSTGKKSIRLKDLEFEIFIKAEDIQHRIAVICDEINPIYTDNKPLLISVLNGSFIFAADLMRQFKPLCEIRFIQLKSYEGTSSTGNITQLSEIGDDIKGRDIIIIEDIIDTGRTMHYLLGELKDRAARSIRIVTLLFKEKMFRFNYDIDHILFDIPDQFVVGYGLDYDGFGRNLPDIYQLKQ